ncbi:MAG: sigma-70 family RNA polymerase sigma factor [Acholeplasmatales bacterium]
MYKAYNDYELLYMVKEGDTVALDILLKKYELFIYKKVYSFFYHDESGDYFQEGVLCLYKAIETFDESYNKTFMRYFEVIINRHFINIYKKNKRYYEMLESYRNELLIEETENKIIEEDIKIIFKSSLEQKVYEMFYLNNKKVKEIAEELNLEVKQIYNAIYRIKSKLLDIYKEEK